MVSGRNTILILGAAYAGHRATELLIKSLPHGWRIVVIERNTYVITHEHSRRVVLTPHKNSRHFNRESTSCLRRPRGRQPLTRALFGPSDTVHSDSMRDAGLAPFIPYQIVSSKDAYNRKTLPMPPHLDDTPERGHCGRVISASPATKQPFQSEHTHRRLKGCWQWAVPTRRFMKMIIALGGLDCLLWLCSSLWIPSQIARKGGVKFDGVGQDCL